MYTEIRMPRRGEVIAVPRLRVRLIEAVAVLARIPSDDVIAVVLNRNGHLTGRGKPLDTGTGLGAAQPSSHFLLQQK